MKRTPSPRSREKPAKARSPARKPAGKSPPPPRWNLLLYVAGPTPKSLAAFANLKRMCEDHLAGRYQIEVVDLIKEPHRAHRDQIIALPTLIRRLPEPIRRVIGDLSNTERVMIGLELLPLDATQ